MILKFLAVIPCLFVWIVLFLGFCPEPVNLQHKMIGLSYFLAGVAVAYPFSLLPWRGAWNWLIVFLSGLPLSLLVYDVVSNTDRIKVVFSSNAILIISYILLLPLLSTFELMLSGKANRLSKLNSNIKL
jgi:hypothetical protein